VVVGPGVGGGGRPPAPPPTRHAVTITRAVSIPANPATAAIR